MLYYLNILTNYLLLSLNFLTNYLLLSLNFMLYYLNILTNYLNNHKKRVVLIFVGFIFIYLVLDRYACLSFVENYRGYLCEYTGGYIRDKGAQGVSIEMKSVHKHDPTHYKEFIEEEDFVRLMDAFIKEHAERHRDIYGSFMYGDINKDGVTINKERYIDNHIDEIIFQEILIKHVYHYFFPPEPKIEPEMESKIESESEVKPEDEKKDESIDKYMFEIQILQNLFFDYDIFFDFDYDRYISADSESQIPAVSESQISTDSVKSEKQDLKDSSQNLKANVEGSATNDIAALYPGFDPKLMANANKILKEGVGKLAQEMVKNTLESKGHDTSDLAMEKDELYRYAFPQHRAGMTKVFTEYYINCKTFKKTEIRID